MKQIIARQIFAGTSYVECLPIQPSTVPYNRIYGLSGSFAVASASLVTSSFVGHFTPSYNGTGSWHFSVASDTTSQPQLVSVHNATTMQLINGALPSFNTSLTSGSTYIVSIKDNNYGNKEALSKVKLTISHSVSSVVPPVNATASITVNTSSNLITISSTNTESIIFYSLSINDTENKRWYPYTSPISYDSNSYGTMSYKFMRNGYLEGNTSTFIYS